MSVSSVRVAIQKAKARKSSEGCKGPTVTKAEVKAVIADAKADGRVSKVERKEITSFYETRRASLSNPNMGMRHTMACPESSRPTFNAAADTEMKNFLYGDSRMHTQRFPENP